MLVSDKKLACIEVVMYTRINGQSIVARAVVFHKTDRVNYRILQVILVGDDTHARPGLGW